MMMPTQTQLTEAAALTTVLKNVLFQIKLDSESCQYPGLCAESTSTMLLHDKGFLETYTVTLFVGPVSISFHSHRILLICVGTFSPCDGFLSQHALLFTRPG